MVVTNIVCRGREVMTSTGDILVTNRLFIVLSP